MKQTHTIDGLVYCATLTIALPNITATDATLGACAASPPPPPPPGVIPPGRQLYGDIGHSDNGSIAAHGVALLDYQTVANVANGTNDPFPGGSAVNIIHNFHRNGYVSLGFTTPGYPCNGIITHDETWAGSSCDCTISSTLGDFSNPSSSPFLHSNVGPGQRLASFKTAGSAAYALLLLPNTSYWLNFRSHVMSPEVSVLGWILNWSRG
jgi:hypothetical protein